VSGEPEWDRSECSSPADGQDQRSSRAIYPCLVCPQQSRKPGGLNLLHASGNDCQKNVGVEYSAALETKEQREELREWRDSSESSTVLGMSRDATDR
jgi:hypothetical protein